MKIDKRGDTPSFSCAVQSVEKEPVSDQDLYALLGAPPSASSAELRRHYEQAVARAQRDGAYRLVEQLSHAYSVLSRPGARAVYDDFGVAVVPERVPGRSGAPVPFRSERPGLGQAAYAEPGSSGEARARRARQRAQQGTGPSRHEALAQRYEQGAIGEQLIAETLAPLAEQGWVLLHDRRKPGSPANLDHLLVGPGGVLVLDAKNWTGGRVRLDTRGIAVGSWRKDDALHAARIDADVVRDALRRQAPQAPVLGGLALVHDMGLAAATFHQGAYVVQRGHLLAWVAGLPVVLTEQEVNCVAGLVDQAFPAKQRDLGTVFRPSGRATRTRSTHARPPRARSRRPLVSSTDKIKLAVFATVAAVWFGGGQGLIMGGFVWFGEQAAHSLVPKVVPSPVVTPLVRAPLVRSPKS